MASITLLVPNHITQNRIDSLISFIEVPRHAQATTKQRSYHPAAGRDKKNFEKPTHARPVDFEHLQETT